MTAALEGGEWSAARPGRTLPQGKVKVKWSRYRPGVAQRVGRGIALLFRARVTRRVSSTPRPHFTPGKEMVTILQEGRKISSPPESDRTVQPVVSRYTDWATRPTIYIYIYIYLCVCVFFFWYFVLFFTFVLKNRSKKATKPILFSEILEKNKTGFQHLKVPFS